MQHFLEIANDQLNDETLNKKDVNIKDSLKNENKVCQILLQTFLETDIDNECSDLMENLVFESDKSMDDSQKKLLVIFFEIFNIMYRSKKISIYSKKMNLVKLFFRIMTKKLQICKINYLSKKILKNFGFKHIIT